MSNLFVRIYLDICSWMCIFVYWNIQKKNFKIFIPTFVHVNNFIWIYSDIHLCKSVDTNLFLYFCYECQTLFSTFPPPPKRQNILHTTHSYLFSLSFFSSWLILSSLSFASALSPATCDEIQKSKLISDKISAHLCLQRNSLLLRFPQMDSPLLLQRWPSRLLLDPSPSLRLRLCLRFNPPPSLQLEGAFSFLDLLLPASRHLFVWQILKASPPKNFLNRHG